MVKYKKVKSMKGIIGFCQGFERKKCKINKMEVEMLTADERVVFVNTYR